MKSLKYHSRHGSTLLIVLFISTIALFVTLSLMGTTEKNTVQITDDRGGRLAYYAANSAIEATTNLYNSNSTLWGKPLNELNLPTEVDPITLDNNALFWVEDINYSSSKSAVVDVIGQYGKSSRKIRANISYKIPDVFGNYGLLSNGWLCLSAEKPTFQMDVHTNGDELVDLGNGCKDYLYIKDPILADGVEVTQSYDPNAESACGTNCGEYKDPVNVPKVDVAKFKAEAVAKGSTTVSATGSVAADIKNAATKYVYVDAKSLAKGLNLTLSGNMSGKVIIVDGDITLDIANDTSLSNVTLVVNGNITVNGNGDIGTSHSGKIDSIIASTGNITLNGSRQFKSLFWTNGIFTQNGSSLAGKVISEAGIRLDGSFILTKSDELYDNAPIQKISKVSTKQQISMDE